MNKESVSYEWRGFPARDARPIKSLFLVAALVLASLAFYWSFGGAYALIAFLALAFSTWRYWLPQTYILNSEFVNIKNVLFEKKKSWTHYRRVLEVPSGLVLSPFSRSSRLEGFKSEFLYLNKELPRNEILEFIRSKITSEVSL